MKTYTYPWEQDTQSLKAQIKIKNKWVTVFGVKNQGILDKWKANQLKKNPNVKIRSIYISIRYAN